MTNRLNLQAVSLKGKHGAFEFQSKGGLLLELLSFYSIKTDGVSLKPRCAHLETHSESACIIMRKMRGGNEAPRGTLLINGSTVCVCNT